MTKETRTDCFGAEVAVINKPGASRARCRYFFHEIIMGLGPGKLCGITLILLNVFL